MNIARIAAAACCAVGLAITAVPAGAAIVTYDVDMNFDPTTIDGNPGDATITGTVSVDSNSSITNINLNEATNSSASFGGAFGSPTFQTLNYNNSTSIYSVNEDQANDEFGGNPFLFVRVQSNCCLLDGIQVGPGFQFDFPVAGGAVQPGNFDSITYESNYLYGNVTVAVTPLPAALPLFGTGLVH
jgi:hypothetical protein